MGHLDLMRTFQRAARRAGVQLAYSRGFNPHPKISFASPLPVGASGWEELAALDVSTEAGEWIPEEDLVGCLNRGLPDGVRVVQAQIVPLAKGTFGPCIRGHWAMRVRFGSEMADAALKINDLLEEILDSEEFLVTRRDGEPRDIRRYVKDLRIVEVTGREAALEMELLQDEVLGARPQDVANALSEKVAPLTVLSMERRVLRTSPRTKEDAGPNVHAQDISAQKSRAERG